MKKQVRWSTITIYAFEIGHNGCSVPSTGGPSIGIVGAPFETYTVVISDTPTASATQPPSQPTERSKLDQYMSPHARINLLLEAGYSNDDIECFCRDGERSRIEREETQAELVRELYQRQAMYYYMKRRQYQLQELQRREGEPPLPPPPPPSKRKRNASDSQPPARRQKRK
ncbi:unnamed protein product [Aphanomyces euteiches]|uniref:Uncharacterized protein n=1 Tax=Aphanomyces euteiches TaxID=100861 RepID=A0A6G0W804_9STRA|nr:hypothetical protein Ae201684_017760 [Aphanomyces euteiches]KAH9064786.1 hypothetical protein Ae201684P_003568 [Aphanomyces euteiches]KAH9150694.1 hypothetical protein AeRB84_006512 [Aphanomyces euteiches]